MDFCKRSSSSLLPLVLLLLVASDLSKAEDSVEKGSPPQVPVPGSKNGTSVANENSFNQTGSTNASPSNTSATSSPPVSPVKVKSPEQMSGNSTVNGTVNSPLSPSNGTLNPPLSPSNGTLNPPLSPSNGTLNPPPSPPQVPGSPQKQSPVEGRPVTPSPTSGSGPSVNATGSVNDGKDGGYATSGSDESSSVQTCDPPGEKCVGDLVTCFWHPRNDTEKQFLILQNEGDGTLTVNVTIQPNKSTTKIVAPKRSDKILISAVANHSLKIILKVGDKSCIKGPQSPNLLQQLPTYATHMTSTYGAHVIFLTALIVGGIWTCCKFVGRCRRADAGIPYRQLEMGVQTQSTSVVETDAGTGWDQWDEDWDEEEAVSKSSQKQHSGDVPINNGHNTTSSKDGWEDWDD